MHGESGPQPVQWEPAAYEHKAALIGRAVIEVANSSALLSKALCAEYETYRADALVVGVDLYNLEAEACGARLRDLGPQACPDVEHVLWDIERLPERLSPPDPTRAGRFGLMLEAARSTCRALPSEVKLRVAASGPISIASKLVGLEPLVTAMALGEPGADRVLQFASELAHRWIRMICQAGFEAIVFDSSAAPPMLSPDLYRQYVRPQHARLMKLIEDQEQRPLILGGDTSGIIADLVQAGATYLVCDFPADVTRFASACPRGITVRRNVDPRLICEPAHDIAGLAHTLRDDLSMLKSHGLHPVAGTGVLPYDTDPRRVRALREAILPGE